MRLRHALRLEDGELVAIIGPEAVPALWRLADDVVEAGGRVITTTTLPLPAQVIARAPQHLSAFEANRARVEATLQKHAHLLITGPVDRTLGKAAGVSAGLIEDLQAIPDLSAILVHAEAGALPPAATRVVSVQPFDAPVPLRDSPRLDVLLDVATEAQDAARVRASELLREASAVSVLIGQSRKPNAVREVWARVGAVVLAAGRSTRMGQTKQLLPWGASTLLGEVVQRLRATSVHEIVVVTGADREAVERVVTRAAEGDSRVRCVFNPDFATSEMARSLQVGLRALNLHCQAVLAALADQPQLQPATVEAILQRWRETLAPAVAPVHAGQRGHPLLLDRALWPQLLALPSSANPRQALPDTIEAVEVSEALLDIDTPEDYARARPD
jgi:molybdenum cofactor cytidylyltransferase